MDGTERLNSLAQNVSASIPASAPPSIARLRGLMAATVAALKQLPDLAHQVANTDLATVVGDLDQLAALGTAGVVTLTAEAEQRGVISESQFPCTAAWLRDAAWHLHTGGSGVVAKCVTILRRHDLGLLAEAIQTTDVTPCVAANIAAEFDKITPDLADGAGSVVLDTMINTGAEHGCRFVKQLRQHLLARYGRDGTFQDEQDSKRRYLDLSAGREENGVFHYELTLDAEGRAVLEAAIGPLSKPQPEPNGDPDPRPVGRRRGEALVEVCRRCTAAGGQSPSAAKAALYVTMTLDDLVHCTGAGTTIGSVDGAALLAPETVRKLACDASVIPMVLGSDSEILDEGRAQRLFTVPQLKALWLRDKQ